MPKKSFKKRLTRPKKLYRQLRRQTEENKHLGDHEYFKQQTGSGDGPTVAEPMCTGMDNQMCGDVAVGTPNCHLPDHDYFKQQTGSGDGPTVAEPMCTGMDNQMCGDVAVGTPNCHLPDHDYFEQQTGSGDGPTVAEPMCTGMDNQYIQMYGDEELVDAESICAEVHVTTSLTDFQTLQTAIAEDIQLPFHLLPMENVIQIVEFYQTRNASVKLSVNIEEDFTAKIFVHRIELSDDHEIWDGLPKKYNSVNDIQRLLSKLQTYSVCIANPDPEFQEIVPVGKGLSTAESSTIAAYREGNFGAVKGDLEYSSTIRSVHCCMLVQGARCKHCSKYRGTLRERKERQEERKKMGPRDLMSSKVRHTFYSKSELMEKINQQKQKIKVVEHENWKLKRQFNRDVTSHGVVLDQFLSAEMKDTMMTCENEMKRAFPDSNSVQRLFWEQQLKSESVKSPSGMRWHPMIIRWCIYLRHKSASAYDALRNAGFIKLPSARTLYDYTNFTKNSGFDVGVLQQLKTQAEKEGMYNKEEDWKSYTGLLFDEIKIKADLVYDKHSGELIGYVNLDKIGNDMLDFANQCENGQDNIAKYMLVLMVRGMCTRLTFPLAGFATQSITADFLYPIIWKAITIMEVNLKLKVLFCTCDGASANRRFFTLHALGNEDVVHFTANPHDPNRKIFFISDVPHLLKTARNCFSNSYSHRNTRKLWRNGKTISWMHLVTLFEQYCEADVYSPCPKLRRDHIDLTAFSIMKVNLAAQVLSDSVASAMEIYFGEDYFETINFIRIMNKFFDCLNVRHKFEGRNKRNNNLKPYEDPNDDRLKWLLNDFLGYFEAWRDSVEGRDGNFTASQKSSMMLSHQTITGLKISVLSIVECVKHMLREGASYILTYNFNQDPLEQLFGHLRHKGGANSNPTVYEAQNNLRQIRTVGCLALPKRNGNTQRNGPRDIMAVDDTKLHRRQ